MTIQKIKIPYILYGEMENQKGTTCKNGEDNKKDICELRKRKNGTAVEQETASFLLTSEEKKKATAE